MGFLFEKCTFAVLDEDTIKECDPFSCGHQDLDDFFHNDAPLYNAQLLGKSYCFRSDKNPSDIVCAFTVSNDSIRVNILPNSRGKESSERHSPSQTNAPLSGCINRQTWNQ